MLFNFDQQIQLSISAAKAGLKLLRIDENKITKYADFWRHAVDFREIVILANLYIMIEQENETHNRNKATG